VIVWPGIPPTQEYVTSPSPYLRITCNKLLGPMASRRRIPGRPPPPRPDAAPGPPPGHGKEGRAEVPPESAHEGGQGVLPI
jgi:hypothetical protein